MFSWQALSPIASHRCVGVCAHVGGWGFAQESSLVKLSEKTSHVVSGGQSTFAENPVLLLLIASAHFSARPCDREPVHCVPASISRHSDTFHRLSPQVLLLWNNFVLSFRLHQHKPFTAEHFLSYVTVWNYMSQTCSLHYHHVHMLTKPLSVHIEIWP